MSELRRSNKFSALPKHKGTEKIQAELRRKLSQVRRESQKKTSGHASSAYFVKREGAGQVVLIGPPNSGKSQLLCRLTHAHPEVGDYPFTTRMPTAGMMLFENVHIQLVDTPPIAAEFMEPWLPQVIRAAHIGVLIVDPNDPDVLGEIEFVLQTLDGWQIQPPRLLVGNKLDQAGAAENFGAVQALYDNRFQYAGVSAATGAGMEVFAQETYRCLDLVRFYSKALERSLIWKCPMY